MYTAGLRETRRRRGVEEVEGQGRGRRRRRRKRIRTGKKEGVE